MGDFVIAAVRDLCLSQARLAERLGLPYDTVRGWSSGRADPSRENRILLASFMRRHAASLVATAEQLESGT